uniref:Glycosyltransferase n=1 Tax=Panax ginseng TaxID=4054 RepID=A0A7G3KFE0_PANGI|nr:UGT85K22 [Panax ginseng]
MGSNPAKKPHAICVTFPAQGHVIPMMQLAKLLHSRGFYITFVNTEFNHRRLLRSKGSEWVNGFDHFKFDTIPEGLPPADRDATQAPAALFESIPKSCLAPFRDLLAKLNSSAEVPPVTCVIADGSTSFAIEAANELGVPEVQFCTSSACGFMGYFHFPELIKRGIVPFKDESFLTDGSLDTKVDWIPGMRSIRLKDLPSFIRTTEPNNLLFNFAKNEAQNCFKASALIFNTFESLEQEVLQAISSKFPHTYPIGPLSLLLQHLPNTPLYSFRPSLWKEDTECLEWLDKKEPNSVIYVNYGSVTVMSDQHLKEFAWGLANSKHPFLWIVRPDIVMGDSAILSQHFLEEIKGRGLLASWCPQVEVLSHESVGGFLTHCGWNSTLESICGGVPMICWPFFAEQQTNCRYSCVDDEWGIGVEVNHDVKHEEIEVLVKQIMEGDKGKRLRRRALEWKKKAKDATSVGGSSYNNFDRFLKEVLSRSE